MSSFNAYARYYDLLYRDKDYRAEARYVHEVIRRCAPGAGSILDLGCGTGAHAAEFAELGYEVHGIDSSGAMLESALGRRQREEPEVAKRLQFTCGDVRSFSAGRTFDVVTALFHVASYQVTNEDLEQLFITAANHLVSDGIFLFDCWYGPAVLADPPVVRVKRIEDHATRVLRIAEPNLLVNENVAEVNYQVVVTDLQSGRTQEIFEQHRLRYLFVPEILHNLGTARLKPVQLVEWMSGAELSSKTWNAFVVARAPATGAG